MNKEEVIFEMPKFTEIYVKADPQTIAIILKFAKENLGNGVEIIDIEPKLENKKVSEK